MKGRAALVLSLACGCLLFAALACTAAEEVQPAAGAGDLPNISAGVNRKLLMHGKMHTDQYGCQWQRNNAGEWCWKRYDGHWIGCGEHGEWQPSWHDKYCYDHIDSYGTCWKKDHHSGHWCWQRADKHWESCPETAPHCSDSWHEKYCYDHTDSYGRCWRKESDGYWSCKQSYSCWSCRWQKTRCHGDWSTIHLALDVASLVDVCLNVNLGGVLGGAKATGGLLDGIGR